MQYQQDPSSSAKSELQRLLTTPPPNAPRTNPATMVHSALERLRDSGDERYLFLRSLLELLQHATQLNSDDELLLFHCITGCRHVVLHGWRRFASVFTQGLRDWMMLLGHHFGSTNNGKQNRTLQVACYTTSVALWKRAWLELTDAANYDQQYIGSSSQNHAELTPQQQQILQAMQQSHLVQIPSNALPFLPTPLALFQYLEHSINDHRMQIPATVFLQQLVEEFAGTKSAVSYQLPLEFHRQTRQSFETHTEGLNACLHLSMKTLSQILPQLNMATDKQQNNNSSFSNISQFAQGMMQIITECLGWEFGHDAFIASTAGTSPSSQTLVRPPKSWSQHHITSPAFCQALWHLHTSIRQHNHPLAHTTRQLILLLASLDGPIFPKPNKSPVNTGTTSQHNNERKEFLASVLQGTLELLQVQVAGLTSSPNQWQDAQWKELIDSLTILGRLVENGKWNLLIQFHKDPLLPGLLQGLTAIGSTIWQQHIQEAQSVQGDLERMEYGDTREDVLNQLLDAVVAVTGDPWLWYSGRTDERIWARQQVGQSLGPLYGIWAHGRLQLAGWEEHYLCLNATDVEEDYEHISAVQLEEEMESLSTLGRIHLKGAIQSLSGLFQETVPQLQSHWNALASQGGNVSPQLAALLEQARLVTLYIGHLLTDDNTGETPVIPDVIAISCREEDETAPSIVSAMEALFSLAQSQALQVAEQPEDSRLSPLLADAVLWCLNRWAPSYIYSVDYSSANGGPTSPLNANQNNNIGSIWSSPEKAQQAVSFTVTLCLHFYCYWPQERSVQESAASLMLSLAKRAAGSDNNHQSKKIRSAMVASHSFSQMTMYHCLTAGTRHSMPRSELEQTVQSKAKGSNTSIDIHMVAGFQRLPYDIRSKILTALLVGCSEPETKGMWEDCLKAVQDAFSSLMHALSTKQVKTDDINAKEMACLCVEMFRGVAGASEMANPSRVPNFITPNLSHLSGLMNYYAEDLTICDRLLQFFRDYTEHFVIMLNKEQCLALFRASTELLKTYSAHHCNSKTRIVLARSTEEANLEEEQKYSDILCAIQLLIHLGTKDFIDICSESTAPGIDSAQVTDVIFFGLQQILPLMTQGLLQMPTLCSQYFSLVGFMMETYPDKIAILPYELFDALVESLLFGMAHHDPTVAKSSLQGIASITREHLKSKILSGHLSRNSDFVDHCSRRLLTDVVFQNKVWDRVEPAGSALLPLAAIDVNRFAAVVKSIVDQIPVEEQRARLQTAFQTLMQPEILHKVASGGLEGRRHRIQFKKDFENFVHDIHSFLILK